MHDKNTTCSSHAHNPRRAGAPALVPNTYKPGPGDPMLGPLVQRPPRRAGRNLTRARSAPFAAPYQYPSPWPNGTPPRYIYEKTHLLPRSKAGGFNVKEAQFYSGCVISAFKYIHSLGVAYRDLKPENLLMDNDGCVVQCASSLLAALILYICMSCVFACLVHSLGLGLVWICCFSRRPATLSVLLLSLSLSLLLLLFCLGGVVNW